MRKALYDDVLDILYGRATNLYGFDVSQIQDLARYIAQQEGVDQIAVLNCTESGSYAKVQCMVSCSSNIIHFNDFNSFGAFYTR